MKRFSRGFPRRPAPGFTVLFIPLTSMRLFSMSAFVESRQRSRYLSLLQIVGALGVVTVHVGVPYCRPFWFFLEVFFVMAGLNMAKALDSDQPPYAYAVSRVRRLGPEISALWISSGDFVISDEASPRMHSFIVSSPDPT